jgi:hypothetical protein
MARTKKAPATEANGNGSPRFTEADLVSKGEKGQDLRVTITPLRERVVSFKIIGTAPLMVCKFSTTKFENMKRAQEAGSQKNSKKTREARDFKRDFEQASHRAREGWYGLPCAAFRRGLIETCRMVGFKMTVAKMSVFVEADGYEATSGDPLVKLNVREPKMDLRPARNANGSCDIRARPMWDQWTATLRVRFDEDQFSVTDITNLLHRMGVQNGMGEGRHNSSGSSGMGFGSFRIELAD